jgi:hypothetical protein
MGDPCCLVLETVKDYCQVLVEAEVNQVIGAAYEDISLPYLEMFLASRYQYLAW